MTKRVEFISYDGDYPNLCSGTLVLKIDGEEVKFPKYCMRSGGGVWFDDDWNAYTCGGPWSIEVPDEYKYLKQEIEDVVNENVEYGCCGGCI